VSNLLIVDCNAKKMYAVFPLSGLNTSHIKGNIFRNRCNVLCDNIYTTKNLIQTSIKFTSSDPIDKRIISSQAVCAFAVYAFATNRDKVLVMEHNITHNKYTLKLKNGNTHNIRSEVLGLNSNDNMKHFWIKMTVFLGEHVKGISS